MPVLKLTATNVPRLKPKPDGRREVYRDTTTTGLLLEVNPSGVRTFVAWYRVRGQGDKGGRVTLGRFRPGIYMLADARRDAIEVLRAAALGEDPALERRRTRQAGTFGQLVDSYLEAEQARIRPATYKTFRRLLLSDRLSALRKTAVLDITRGDLIRLIDKIKDDAQRQGQKGYEANRTFSAIHRVFSWAVSRDLVPANPAGGIRKPVKELPRQRTYTDAEIKAVWNALDGSAMCDAIRLCFYTAVRMDTALGALWEEVDLDAGVWTLRGDRAGNKAGVPWLIPLVPEAVDLLRARANDTPWVFPTRGRDGEWTRAGNASSIARRVKAASGVSDFRTHDVRRVVNSFLASAAGRAVPLPVRDSILQHRPPNLESTYNIHDYFTEKKAALERWARHLGRVTADEPGKVLEMAR